ncbi:MAG: hypothetical protein Q9159_000946 [Coniocarpon cinnabarinum]
MEELPNQPSPEDVNDILKRKRKVRCDSQVPCKTCVERQHPELCTFNPPSKRRDSGSSHADRSILNGDALHGKDDWDRISAKLYGVERALAELKDDLRSINGVPPYPPDSMPPVPPPSGVAMHERDKPSGPSYVKAMEMSEHSQLTGHNVHLGGGSVPALINALAKGNDYSKKVQSAFGDKTMLPVLGLDNESATYPFVSLWGTQDATTRVADLRKVLPSDAECTETFRQYKEGAHVLYPAIADIESFESELLAFLANRRTNDQTMNLQVTNDSMDGVHIRWIGLLFAVFASGSQFAPIPKRDRELSSQVYACCSFECLRLVNYLSNASVDVVQTLLILGNVLSNTMNAGAAWVLLGMTLRLARVLGADSATEHANKSSCDLMLAKVWWALLWQDSLLCISYDRATSTATPETQYPPPDLISDRGGLSFGECMYRIARVGLLTVRNRTAPQSIESRLSRCVDLRDDIARMREAAADHLKSSNHCRTIRDQVEYWVLHLHASYMTAELCRPAISPGTADFDKGTALRRLCIANLLSTVEAFNGLANASPMHARAWAVLHRTLSAALLLGILGEPLRNSRAHDVIRRLIEIMKTGSGPDQKNSVGFEAEMDGPVTRSVSALNKLSAPESITPRNMEENAQQNQAIAGMPPNNNQGILQPHAGQQMPYTMPGMAELSATRSTADIKPDFGSPSLSQAAAPSASANAFATTPGQVFDNVDDSAFFLPTPLAGFEDESSPYALMDSIIWGGNGGLGSINGRNGSGGGS